MKRWIPWLISILLICNVSLVGAVGIYGEIEATGKVINVTGTHSCGVSMGNFSLTTEIDLGSFPTNLENAPYPFLYFRSNGTTDGYVLRINGLRSALSLAKISGGNQTWIMNIPHPLPANDSLKMRIDGEGGNFKFYIATDSYGYFQKPTATLTDTSYSKGNIVFAKPSVASKMTIKHYTIRQLTALSNGEEEPEPVKLTGDYQNPYLGWEDCAYHPYGGAIRYLAGKKIIQGKFTNAFCPDQPIRVHELIKVWVASKGIEVQENQSDWAKPYIDAALRQGMITPMENYTEEITREAAAMMLGISSGGGDPKSLLTRGEACAWIAGMLDRSYKLDDTMVTASYREYDEAFSNPLKGMRGHSNGEAEDDDYITLVHYNLTWDSLEASASDTVDKIITKCNAEWSNYPKQNIKVVPQVVLQIGEDNYWPTDMTTGDYTSDQFCQRLTALIQKLGQAWDQDERVAYIYMGIIGKWGEMQSPYPSVAVRRILRESFETAFTNKIVQTNLSLYNTDIDNGKFGWCWFSFGHWDNLGLLDLCPRTNWQNVPLGGEAAFDWGNTLGTDPDDALIHHLDRYVDLVRYSHASYLGWISRYDPMNAQAKKNAGELQKVMGYRYVVTDAAYTKAAKSGTAAKLVIHLTNTGSAPMYYNWPIQVAFLNPDTHSVVKKINVESNMKSWLPSEDYSEEKIYTMEIPFTVPTLSAGEYILAVTGTEPGSARPSLRFANENYYSGGYTVLGRFCVGDTNENPYITDGFDELKAERLGYTMIN